MSSKKLQHLVFVYGTLKTGGPNFKQWMENGEGQCHLVGVARTVARWPLIIATEYNVPYLLKAQDRGKRVYGELVCADDAKVKMLDRLECHPTHYVRQDIDVEIVSEATSRVAGDTVDGSVACGSSCAHCCHLSPGTIVSCQAYLVEDFKDYMLEERHYDNFTDGVNGKYYVCPQDRPRGYWPDYFRALHKLPYVPSEQSE